MWFSFRGITEQDDDFQKHAVPNSRLSINGKGSIANIWKTKKRLNIAMEDTFSDYKLLPV